MEDMTGELRLIVLRKDCFAGCNDDDATTSTGGRAGGGKDGG